MKYSVSLGLGVLFLSGSVHAEDFQEIAAKHGPTECFRDSQTVLKCLNENKLVPYVWQKQANGKIKYSMPACTSQPQAARDCLKVGFYSAVAYESDIEGIAAKYLAEVTTLASSNHIQDQAESRCQAKMGTAVNPDDTLNRPTGQKRTIWASKCVPYQNGQLQTTLQTLLKDNEKSLELEGKKQKHGSVLYPTFGKRVVAANQTVSYTIEDASLEKPRWRAPTEEEAKCYIPRGWYISAYCAAGCYSPEQRILTSEGYLPISEAREKKTAKIVSLKKGSMLDSISLQHSKVKSFLRPMEDVSEPLVVIRTAKGKTLRVTLEHPLVLANGEMEKAENLKVGDKLVEPTGDFDNIQSIRTETFTGKTENLFVDSGDLAENVVVAEGVLQGSAYYQNRGAEYLNRVLFRADIADKLIQ